MTGVRVLVADDQALFRRAAGAVIRATPGFEPAGEARSGEEAVELAAALQPDLVLIDVNMPGIGGIEAARRIDGPVCVLVSSYRAEDLGVRPRACGAAAYVHKADLEPRVLSAVWEAAVSSAAPPGTPAPP